MEEEKNYREQAEFLWELLNEIDEAGDLFKPKDVNDFERYFSFIRRKLKKRFKIFKSNGNILFTPQEWEENRKKFLEDLTKFR